MIKSVNFCIKLHVRDPVYSLLLANKGKVSIESSSDETDAEETKQKPPTHKPTQTRFSWTSMWQRDTFPRLVPAFGLLGKAY